MATKRDYRHLRDFTRQQLATLRAAAILYRSWVVGEVEVKLDQADYLMNVATQDGNATPLGPAGVDALVEKLTPE